MSRNEAIFLSASVPEESRHPRYFATADKVAIRDAVRALVTVAVPHYQIVWGGHPAITPLVRIVIASLGLHQKNVVMYQSEFFANVLPPDNEFFEHVVMTPAKDGRDASLLHMRQKMLSDYSFRAGIFIGGMEGVEDEYGLFQHMHSTTPAIPIASTGGAARLLYERAGAKGSDLLNDYAYPTLFRRVLGIR